MKISSRFSVAVHCLLYIACADDEKVTSDKLAVSVNTNPVVIRKILGKLKKAGLIEVYPGTGGMALLKSPSSITLLDIFRAADVVEEDALFHIHENSDPDCPVGKNILSLLEPPLQRAQDALERELDQVTLQDLMDQMEGMHRPSYGGGNSSISTVLL